MRFEGKDLKDHAEPVTEAELRPGQAYFAVQFLDEKLLIPTVEPLVFLGKNLRAGDVDRLYFQHFDSYIEGVRIESANEDDQHDFQIPSEAGINHIFEYERALDALMMCALRRRQSEPTDL